MCIDNLSLAVSKQVCISLPFEMHTNIKRSEMKELLLLYTNNVYFMFNSDIYQQCNSVAMGSPLGPVIAGMFMVEL